MKFAVIGGKGRFGQKYCATLKELGCDYFPCGKTDDFEKVIGETDTVCIVTPPATHFKLAKAALERGKHVILEKPATESAAECRELQQLAVNRGLTCQVNYSYLWHPGYRKIRATLSNRRNLAIGSMGFATGPDREYSTLKDWGSHDLALVLDLVKDDATDYEIKAQNYDGCNGLFNILLRFRDSNNKAFICAGNRGIVKYRSFRIEADHISPMGFVHDFKIPTLKLMLSEYIDRRNRGEIWNNLDLVARVTEHLEKLQSLLPKP